MESTNNENAQKGERTSRSVIRTRGRPRKSPSRMSPSRRSPSRRSPSRKSPGRSPSSRTRKLATGGVRIAKVSIPRADVPKREASSVEPSTKTKIDIPPVETDDFTELLPLQTRLRETTSQVTRRSTRILSNLMKSEREQKLVSLTRSVDRAVSLPVDRRAHLYDFVAEQRERGLSMQRDRDLSKILHYEEEALPDSSTMTEKNKKEIELISKPQEWGGWTGALCLIFVLPIAIILPQIACFDNQCNSAQFRISTRWESYLDVRALGAYVGFLCFLGVASLVPVGPLIDGQQNKSGRLQYRMNGIVAALLAITILGVCEYREFYVSEFILSSSLRLSIAGWLLGTAIATGLYVKGGKASVAALNMYGSTNNIVYDFWQGREINPRIGPFDVKILLLRANVIGSLILNSAVIAKSINDAESPAIEDLNLTVLVVCSLHIFYCLDSLVFESACLTSFKILYEGTGYMVCVGNLLYPFLLTLGTRYLLYQKIHQTPYVLAAIVLLFFAGYLTYRISNLQKNEFRTNPFSPALAHLDTISTSRGKRIISSGLWGHVRHPNYLGDIMIHWSLASTALTRDLFPYYPAVFYTLALMHRAIRDEARCRNRYGSAWEEYCSRVKSSILKRVF